MAQKNVAHGKEFCRWCDGCGTLLLGDSCSRCGSEGREFRINSPGDIRPCMGDTTEMPEINEEQLGISAEEELYAAPGGEVYNLEGEKKIYEAAADMAKVLKKKRIQKT